jgi:hypothetical protein
MKRTAGELIEIIPIREEFKGATIQVSAICPFCGHEIQKVSPGNDEAVKEAALNGVISHIRCTHHEQ